MRPTLGLSPSEKKAGADRRSSNIRAFTPRLRATDCYESSESAIPRRYAAVALRRPANLLILFEQFAFRLQPVLHILLRNAAAFQIRLVGAEFNFIVVWMTLRCLQPDCPRRGSFLVF